MCTVSWLRTAGGYTLLCNRDEKRTRRPAAPPAIHMGRFIAPIDGDYHGAWISVNDRGLSLALLNGPGPVTERRQISRGLLVLSLAGSYDSYEVLRVLHTLDLTRYAPFTLVAIEPASPATTHTWNGNSLITSHGDHQAPLTSSSFDPERVLPTRKTRYPKDPALQALRDFHASHQPTGPDAFSVCMHRPDAETVSYSEIHVTSLEIQFHYTPAAPCTDTPRQTVCMTRRKFETINDTTLDRPRHLSQ